jgi:thiol-disulfide isomerase/thioredoxin
MGNFRSVFFLLICLIPFNLHAAADDPPVRVVDLPQLEAALAEHRGKGILLNFWAIWCEPCIAEMPDLVSVAREFEDRGGVVLTVSYDLMVPDVTSEETLERVRGFVVERGFDLRVFIYDADDYDAINERFGLPGPIPMTVAIDRKGAVVDRHAGKSTRDEFAAMMRKAIAGS